MFFNQSAIGGVSQVEKKGVKLMPLELPNDSVVFILMCEMQKYDQIQICYYFNHNILLHFM